MSKERIYSLVQIVILLIGTVAFGWMLGGEVGFVRGENGPTKDDAENGPTKDDASIATTVFNIPLDYDSTGGTHYNRATPRLTYGQWLMRSLRLGSKNEAKNDKNSEKNDGPSSFPEAPKNNDSVSNATKWGDTPLSALGFANIAIPVVITAVNMIWIQSGDYSDDFKDAWSQLTKVIDSTAGANQAIRMLTDRMDNTNLAGTFNTISTIVTTAVIIGTFIAVFSKPSKGYVVVEYECQPWQAPLNGDCDACNDGELPCNIYKCKSLGQSCELVNQGIDGSEVCVENNTRDTTPPQIFPNSTYLTKGYAYSDVNPNPPSPGMRIISDWDEWQEERPSEIDNFPENGSIKAFDPLTFAITTDEITRCKIDTDRSKSYEEMFAYMGGSFLFNKTHKDNLILPNQEAFNSSGIELSSGDLELCIICEDVRGNKNEIPYTIRLKIDPAPDTTPPKIMAGTILSESCVSHGTENVSVSFYINEPVDGCRWDYTNDAYGVMKNMMDCYPANGIDYLSVCNATFLGVKSTGQDYFVKCNDTKGNFMLEPEKLRVRSSSELSLKITSPENGSSIYGSINTLKVVLSAQTGFGCDSGLATCSYFQDQTWIEFAETNTTNGVHNQELYLPDGDYTYFIKCQDNGGNVAEENVSFSVETSSGVVISGIEAEGTTITFRTYAPSDCAYSVESCEFTFDQGTIIPPSKSVEHYFNYEEGKTYHIKCMDEYNPEPADCTIKIKADDFL